MISVLDTYMQPETKIFSRRKNELPKNINQAELREDVIFVRRKIEQPTALEIRFARLKKLMQSRSSSIF